VKNKKVGEGFDSLLPRNTELRSRQCVLSDGTVMELRDSWWYGNQPLKMDDANKERLRREPRQCPTRR
jgi:hypothetical protein